MNSLEFDRGYSRLESYFNTKPNDSRSEVWFEQLRGYDGHTWDAAVGQVIEQERYFPTLGAIKAVCWNLSPGSRDNETPEIELSEGEMAFSREFFPLFMKFSRRQTDATEISIQMCYFAKKHGVHGQMFQFEPCQHCGAGGDLRKVEPA